MESARACKDAAVLRRFAWRDYLFRGLVDEWDRTLQEACASNKNESKDYISFGHPELPPLVKYSPKRT